MVVFSYQCHICMPFLCTIFGSKVSLALCRIVCLEDGKTLMNIRRQNGYRSCKKITPKKLKCFSNFVCMTSEVSNTL